MGAASGPAQDIHRLALKGSILEVAGFGGAQVLRLGSNLIVSRLIFPEAYGLMTLVYLLADGLTLLSDVGIEQAVIQNQRGEERRFLNTAWTVHVVRGIVLWVAALLLAYPMSVIYRQPQLLTLIPVGTLAVLLSGFNSTSLFTLRRRLQVGRPLLVELGAQAASVAVMIPWALVRPSVWVLAGGGLVSALVKLAASHLIDVGHRNRPAWDPEAARAIVRLGKWIFASSAIYFLYRQGDRLLLGRYVSVAQLGIYSIAVMLSDAVATAVGRVARGVYLSVFSRVRDEGIDRLRDVYYQARLRLDAAAVTSLGALAVLGSRVVDLLWDDRYAEAGWMLEVLAVRVVLLAILSPCEQCLIALGHSRYSFFANVGRALWIVLGIPLIWPYAGIVGLIWVTASSELPALLVFWLAFRRHGLLRVRYELRAVGLFAIGLAVGLAVDRVLP